MKFRSEGAPLPQKGVSMSPSGSISSAAGASGKWRGSVIAPGFARIGVWVCLAGIALLLVAGPCLAQTPEITLSKKIGPPTTAILVSGSGFPPSVAVYIYFDTAELVSTTTNGAGSFTDVGVNVPATATPGEHKVGAKVVQSNESASTSFLVRTDWSEKGFRAEGTRFNPYENVLDPTTAKNLGVVWTYNTGYLYSAAAVAEGYVYFAGFDSSVYAFNPATGVLVWTYVSNLYNDSTPAVANGIVFVGSADDAVFAVNAITGALIWTYTTRDPFFSAPAVAEGIVYIGCEDNNLYALDAATGALVWKYTTGGFVDSSPAVANGIVYVNSYDDYTYALNAATGVLIWKYNNGAESETAPAVADGVVYISSGYDNVYALNAVTGTLVWKYTTENFGYLTSPAVAKGIVYVGSEVNDSVYALNAKTGAVVWTVGGLGDVSTPPAVADGVIYIGLGNDNIYALNAATGAVIWQYDTGDIVYSSPAVADGFLYNGSAYGAFAFGVIPSK
jgi:outer membrane protein assembly factor BamB